MTVLLEYFKLLLKGIALKSVVVRHDPPFSLPEFKLIVKIN